MFSAFDHLGDHTEDEAFMAGMLSMLEIVRSRQNNNIMLLCIVDNPTIVDTLIEIADGRLGGLPEPHNGIAFVIDVESVIGLRHVGE